MKPKFNPADRPRPRFDVHRDVDVRTAIAAMFVRRSLMDALANVQTVTCDVPRYDRKTMGTMELIARMPGLL